MTKAQATGIPPLHSIFVVAMVTALCFTYVPSPSSLDRIATIEAFTSAAFDFISMEMIAAVRLCFAAVGVGTTTHMIMYHTAETSTNYRPGSLLKSIPIRLKGLRTQSYFTPWAWGLLTLSFLLSGTVPLLAFLGREDLITPRLLRVSLVTFEMAAPTEFLVAFVVKHAIWPGTLQSAQNKNVCKDPTANLKTFSSLMMHNGCICMLLIEIALLGRIPFLLSHIALAPLLGLVYILFAWYSADKWIPGQGPQYLYFFLDTTLGWGTTFAIVVLLCVLFGSYVIIWALATGIGHVSSVLGRLFVSAVLGRAFCRLAD
mmetsp:Transcript_17341/g.21634  ORF Transcript_17341/g.21634 Transcript_17341/m.21634 type:complete len:316 (-) Transcript_17341:115-1062(-)|eukprot:CAMPEP_0172482424 /NCGR_PEP_ID=MMETSP1066-20121228/8815_1 /TAXON_ID=671091 /ORGANISM="Coscinodiscus wailesii, Strain CCMP2513" /LENGTH=315 /DNA_ID=CAMNT_0013245517 /DNA_START=77 /DNA_END=1024 /DNA_ORIENTATION=-